MSVIDVRHSTAELERWLKDNAESRLVICTGCFDLFHPGHVRFLNDCAEQGEKLLVLLSSDADIKEFKGESRPIILEDGRAEILASIKSVDLVAIYSGVNIWDLYELCQPYCITTSSDHASHQDYMQRLKEYCQQVYISDRGEHIWSTTKIIEALKNGRPVLEN